uniref:LysE family translocator n=1 Tax=Thaumasiovibrio occultus TaxID=1891184 RepID=UPI000B350868|nr:LysE family translocator [Thaumasiovibrio occultus]
MISVEFLITSLVVVLIPGTGVLYTLATGLFRSKKAAMFAAFGCTLGIVPSLLASVFGLAALFHTSALAYQVVKYVGVCYLLYLAWGMWRSASPLAIDSQSTLTDDDESTQSNQQQFWSVALKGFLINILNPKLSLFFLAFLPQFIAPDAASPLTYMLVLGMVFMLMTFVVFVIYGCMAHAFRALLLQSESASTVMQKIFSASFALMGVKLAMTESS